MSKDIEIEDARARIKELEDLLNEKMIDHTNVSVKLKEAYDEIGIKDKNIKTLQFEYRWLSGQYNAMLAEIHNSLDELNYNIKHSNLAETIDKRNEEIKAAKEKKTQEEVVKTVKPGPPIPKGVTEEQMNPPKGYA